MWNFIEDVIEVACGIAVFEGVKKYVERPQTQAQLAELKARAKHEYDALTSKVREVRT